MSKYIKLEDAEKLLTNALRIAQGFDEPLERSLVDLPTIEVSEEQLSKLQSSENSVENTTVSEDFTSISRANSKLEVSEDCISREFALKVIDDCINYPTNGDKACAIKNAPSVTPTERTGEWKHTMTYYPYCSECEWVPEEGEMTHGSYNYCPNCGARMFAKDTNVLNKKGATNE